MQSSYIGNTEEFLMSLLSQKHLQDEQAAYDWVEARMGPNGPVCPHCAETKRLPRCRGRPYRLYKCYACRKQFNVKVAFEESHIAMHLWLQAFYLIPGSKKGISSKQLHRTLGVTLKSAWFMPHRIREAVRTGTLSPPMGLSGAVVKWTRLSSCKNARCAGLKAPTISSPRR